MKKLIPALCMLLVAAALMGTSTYAWFTMNTQVSATGMNVTAAVPSSLYIASDKNMTDKSFTLALEGQDETPTALLPASAVAPAAGTEEYQLAWYTAKGTSANNGAAVAGQDGNKYSLVGAAPTGKAYYRAETFYLMNEQENYANLALIGLTVEHTNAANNDDLMDALRVMIVASEGNKVLNSFVYTPVAGDNTTGKAVDSANTTTAVTAYSFTANGGVAAGTANQQVLISSMTKNVAYKIDVYVFLDGEDAACTSDNRNELTVTNTKIGLTFGTAGSAVAGA